VELGGQGGASPVWALCMLTTAYLTNGSSLCSRASPGVRILMRAV
jgi:hypothetical protein